MELSIEDKAKAYDKALERAIKLKEDPQSVFYEYSPNEGDTICDYIFPELKESEDKRMIQYFKDLAPFDKADELYEKYGFSHKDALAWLEKQGEQKETLCDKCKKTQPSHSCQDITALGRCALEKQGEQKLTEFEKAVKQVMEEVIECGDTHNLKADAEMLLSLAQKSDEEYNITGIHSKHAEGKLSEMIKNLKSVNEMKVEPKFKVGDVLCDKSCTTLNKDGQPNLEIIDIKDGVYICDNGSIPVSQQDNFELIAKKIEHNPAWSEEDDKMLDSFLHKLEVCDLLSNKEGVWIKNKLKNIKERVQPQSTWKPSDAQIEALDFAADCIVPAEFNFKRKELKGLLEQLKKLRKG